MILVLSMDQIYGTFHASKTEEILVALVAAHMAQATWSVAIGLNQEKVIYLCDANGTIFEGDEEIATADEYKDKAEDFLNSF